MGKHKKKHSKKNEVSDDLLDTAALSIKKFRKVTNQLAKLSTGQKVAGGLALLAAGFIYLDQRKGDAVGLVPNLDWLRLGEAKEAEETYAAEADDKQPLRPPVAGKGHRVAKPKKQHAHRPKKDAPSADNV
jgi:hypothetical protein